MARVPHMQHPAPIRAALAPILPDDAYVPVRLQRIPEGIVGAYSPAQISRDDAWAILTDVYGSVTDVTPGWVVAAA